MPWDTYSSTRNVLQIPLEAWDTWDNALGHLGQRLGTLGTTPWDTYGTTRYYYVITRGDTWDTLGTLMGQQGAKNGVFWQK